MWRCSIPHPGLLPEGEGGGSRGHLAAEPGHTRRRAGGGAAQGAAGGDACAGAGERGDVLAAGRGAFSGEKFVGWNYRQPTLRGIELRPSSVPSPPLHKSNLENLNLKSIS